MEFNLKLSYVAYNPLQGVSRRLYKLKRKSDASRYIKPLLKNSLFHVKFLIKKKEPQMQANIAYPTDSKTQTKCFWKIQGVL